MSENNRSLMERIAKELSAERMMNEMSQEDLAKVVGTKKSNISRLESGRQNISVNYLEILADAMGKDVIIELHDKGIEYSENNLYSLRLYDEELVSFSMRRTASGTDISVLYVNDDRREVFPIGLKTTGEGILKWLGQRVIPKNREMVRAILSSLDLAADDLKGIIDISFGLSLNDSYWVVPRDFKGSFSDYDLYENDFNSALSLIAYTGYGSITNKIFSTP